MADRKQMERLLGRESDKRIPTTGVLYIDSYGNKEAILTTPMIYDALFLDMCADGSDSIELANALREAGYALPIIFCSSKTNYRSSAGLPANCFFLDKPINPDKLSSMIDTLLAITKKQIQKIEFRSLTETFYLTEDDIMYASPEGRTTILRLMDGQERLAASELVNLAFSLGFEKNSKILNHPLWGSGTIRINRSGKLILIDSALILRPKEIRSISFSQLTMSDNATLKIPHAAKKTLERLIVEKNS